MKTKSKIELESNEMQVSIGTLSMISRLLFPIPLMTALAMDCIGIGSERIQGPAGEIYTESIGFGDEAVVMIHSLAGNTSHWRDSLEYLKNRKRVITLDLRGHGKSSVADNADFKITSLAADVEAVVRHFRLKKVILVGHSMGGLVALEYAGKHSDMVSGLLLVDSSGDSRKMPKEQVRAILDQANRDVHAESMVSYFETMLVSSNKEVREKIIGDLNRLPRNVRLEIFADLFRYDPHPALAGYRGPVYAIVTPYNNGPESLHNLRKGISFAVVKNTGHWLFLDRPEEFRKHLDRFLDQIRDKN
ncbi:alpha/beta fold hydrolase [Leptospira sp. WS92.C1]